MLDQNELERLILRAICDPGSFLARGDDYTESIPHWGMRAVFAALKEAGLEITDPGEQRRLAAQDLRWAAQGRRYYAQAWSQGTPERRHLDGEAQTLISAARLVEGNQHTMRMLLPVHMWPEDQQELASKSEPPNTPEEPQ